jgi:hypothetical protein
MFLLIDVSMPTETNVVKKKAEKVLTYKNILADIQRNVQCEGKGNIYKFWCKWKLVTIISEAFR